MDAGSNKVSDFAVKANGALQLIDTVSSGGTGPVSVAIHGSLVEALQVGASFLPSATWPVLFRRVSDFFRSPVRRTVPDA
jgi:hypothetical protein